jgi:asparagine synthase (glutamine-hydrolysing)
MAGLFARRDPTLGRKLEESGEGWLQPGIQLRGRISRHPPSGTVCVASARVDNRRQLFDQLELEPTVWGAPSPRDAAHDDTHLIHAAYRRWGAACVERIYGDWAFAVWEERSRELFLARDHFGITSLYYCLTPDSFAFATDQKELLALHLVPEAFDQLYLAQVLVAWPAYHGERTVRHGILRLPPAHTLRVTPEREQIHQYWHLEHTPPLVLRDRREYVEGFQEVFDEAVGARLRRDEGGRIGSTLSGGLDSGSITATAARALAVSGERLWAFTEVPAGEPNSLPPGWVGNEWALAQATASLAGNVDLEAITAEDVSPIAGMREELAVQLEPCHGAANAFWQISLHRRARAKGCSVLLIGQSGNAGISWEGSVFSQPLAYQLRALGTIGWLKQRSRRALPPQWLKAIRLARTGGFDFDGSAIHPSLARRLDLKANMYGDPHTYPPRNPIQERAWLMPGRSMVGALHAQLGRAAGLEIRDPSADARVLAFTWAIPDEVFIDPQSGTRRWLIREAMAGRLPDEVRWNRRRGWQAADLPFRLRQCAREVSACLEAVAKSSAAAEVIHPQRLSAAWQAVLTQAGTESLVSSGSILMPGLMAGLFLNGSVGCDRL